MSFVPPLRLRALPIDVALELVAKERARRRLPAPEYYPTLAEIKRHAEPPSRRLRTEQSKARQAASPASIWARPLTTDEQRRARSDAIRAGMADAKARRAKES